MAVSQCRLLCSSKDRIYLVLNNALQFEDRAAREQWAHYIFAGLGLTGIAEAE